jgi:hypothetical protein
MVNKNFVGIGRDLMKEIYRYFPTGTTGIYAEPSADKPKTPEQESDISLLCEVITPTSCEIYLRSEK